jgi:hypothetical protein
MNCKLELNICEQFDDLNCCNSCYKELDENPAHKFFEERDCAYCRAFFDAGKDTCKECGFDLNSWNQIEELQEEEECKCEECGTTKNIAEYWWIEAKNQKWVLCEECGEKQEQEKC